MVTKTKKTLLICFITILSALFIAFVTYIICAIIEIHFTDRIVDYKGVWTSNEITINFNDWDTTGYATVKFLVDDDEHQFYVKFDGGTGADATIYDKTKVKIMDVTNEVKNGNTCYLKVYKDYYFNKFEGKTFVLKKQTAPQAQTQTE